MDRAERLFLAVFILLVLLRAASFDLNSHNLYWDEVVFLHLSEQFPSYHSEIGESFRPPLFPFLLSLAGISKDNIFPARILTTLIIIIDSLLILYLSYKFSGSLVSSLISASLFLALPLSVFWNLKILTEGTAILFLLLSFLLLFQNRVIPAFLSLGAATLTRYLTLIFVPVFVIYLISINPDKDIKKKIIRLSSASAVYLAALIPLFIFGYMNYHNLFGMFVSNMIEASKVPQPFWFYIPRIFAVFNILLIPFFISFWSRFDRKYIIYHISIIAYLLGISLLVEKYDRFFLYILPLILIVISCGIRDIFLWIKENFEGFTKKAANVSFIFILVMSIAAYSLSGYAYSYDKQKETSLLIEGSLKAAEFRGNDVYCRDIPYCYYFGGKRVVSDEGIDHDTSLIFLSNYKNDSEINTTGFNLVYSKREGWAWVKIYQRAINTKDLKTTHIS